MTAQTDALSESWRPASGLWEQGWRSLVVEGFGRIMPAETSLKQCTFTTTSDNW
jgi:hypothetical protein